ncbi:hypothetical protein KBD61_05570 [Patescibacteria group bacterium]|nr:hypothetical protein [Patescibacteria group bacterium]MBP9710460.1 hypothetical protein [Patescibacteria group bacterium]
MPLVLRAILLTVPRFILILAMVLGLNRFDPSPLPEWTVAVLAYVLHFVITFVFGLWTMRGRIPTAKQIGLVTVITLVFGVVWEMGLYIWMTSASLTDIFTQFNAKSLVLLVMYALATILAGLYTQKKNRQAQMPEGLSA